MRDLAKCRHLIVTFSADGALWLDFTKRDAPQATLIFDPADPFAWGLG